MSVFLVDSNFFIQAHRASYPLDIVHSFWNKIKQLAEAEKIISIDKVKQEIYSNEDALKKWCLENLPKDFFQDSSHVIDSYQTIVNWAISKNNHYLPNAISGFLEADQADAWLVAYANTDKDNIIIVTYETSEPNRKSKIKIPDVCINLEIQYCNTIEMFRGLGETF